MGEPAKIADPAVWVVGFRGKHAGGWLRLFEPGYRHVFALHFCAEHHCWLLFDPSFNGLRVAALSRRELWDLLVECWLDGGRFVKFTAHERRISRPLLFVSCVTAVKRLLGIRGCALSPHQLYRYLLANGGEPVFTGEEQWDSAASPLAKTPN